MKATATIIISVIALMLWVASILGSYGAMYIQEYAKIIGGL